VEDCKCYCPDIDKWTTNSSTAKAKLEAIDILFSDDTYTTVKSRLYTNLNKCVHPVKATSQILLR